MFFGDVPTEQANDCILAHSLRVENLRIRKGEILSEELIRNLLANNVDAVTVARLEPGDIHEDEAAHQLANALSGPGVYLGDARTGRVNVYAAGTGLLEINRPSVLASNSVSHSITFATLAENQWVPQGKLVATAKIIPFAVAADELQMATTAVTQSARPALQLHTPTPHRAHLVQTTLSATTNRVLEKTVNVCAQRLAKRQAELVSSATCTHASDALASALSALADTTDFRDGDWILVVGASAISDIDDVIPAAIRQLGGNIERLGIPVDPGNLLMNAELQGHRVIGLPGCARSPKHNGFDQFLDRMSCNLPIDDNWVNSLAVGGLLNEIPERPQQRTKLPAIEPPTDKNVTPNRKIAAVILAAGRSQRFGHNNKLLALWQQKPILQHTLENLAASKVDELLLVTGHDSDALHQSVPLLQQLQPMANNSDHAKDHSQSCSHTTTHAGRIGESEKPLNVLHNPDHRDGMATSLRSAISFLAQRNRDVFCAASQTNDSPTQHGIEAVLVCLGDMPMISTSTINQLIDAWRSDLNASAFIPVLDGKQGNPVIMTSGLFDSLLSLSGDTGARKLLQDSPAVVTEVRVDDPAILQDIDTTEQLNSLELGV